MNELLEQLRASIVAAQDRSQSVETPVEEYRTIIRDIERESLRLGKAMTALHARIHNLILEVDRIR